LILDKHEKKVNSMYFDLWENKIKKERDTLCEEMG
jgi:hypothetical protein